MGNMGKNNHNLVRDSSIKKQRYKLYKAGKLWLVAGLTTLSLGLAQFGLASEVKADSATNDDQGESETTDAGTKLQQPQVVLSAQQKVNESGTNTNVTSSTDTEQTTATSDSQTSQNADTNGAQVAETGASTATDTTASDTDQSSSTHKAASPVNSGSKTAQTNTENDGEDSAKQTTDQSNSNSTTINDNRNDSTSDNTANAETEKQAANATVQSPDQVTDQSATQSADSTNTDKTAGVSDVTSTTQPVTAETLKIDKPAALAAKTAVSLLQTEQGTDTANAKTDGTATADDGTTKSTTADSKLPAGFTVTDPDYAAGSYAASVANSGDNYIYYEMEVNNYHLDLATNRQDPSNLILIVSKKNGTGWSVVSTTPITGSSYTDPTTGTIVYNDPQSVYVSHSNMTIVTNVYGKLGGNGSGWNGDVVIKPVVQTQTTNYVDQNGNPLAGVDSVEMQGLSGQKYTTSPSEELEGYTPAASDNANGYMSPFIANGQSITEVLHNGSTPSTVKYTVKDIDAGTILAEFTYASGATDSHTLTYTKGAGTSLGTGSTWQFGSFKVINPYIPQTTTITYTYDAQNVNVNVKYVDQNGNEIPGQDPLTKSFVFNESTTIDHPTINGYTFDTSYPVTTTDNPDSYTVTSLTADNTVTLHYKANTEKVIVKHVDQAGNSIGTDSTIDADFNTTVDLPKTDPNYSIDGYEVDPTSPTSYKVSSDGDGTNEVTIHYIQQQNVSVHYVDQNGAAIDSSLLGSAPTTLRGIVDEHLTVTSPAIAGYTAYPDNPTDYTVVNGDNSVTLKYIQTQIKVSVGDGPDYAVVDGNGQPVKPDTAVNGTDGPKWPTGLTDDNLTKTGNQQDDLDKVVTETIHYLNSDGTVVSTTTVPVYFTRTATVDFSQPDKPVVTFGDWVATAGPDSVTTSQGADYTPDETVTQKDGSTAFVFDSTGKALPDDATKIAGQQVTADSANIDYYVVYSQNTTYTRTIHFVNVDAKAGTDNQLLPDQQQTVTFAPQVTLSVDNDQPAVTLGSLVPVDGTDSFAAYTAPTVDNFAPTTTGAPAATITPTSDGTALSQETTINYTSDTKTVKVQAQVLGPDGKTYEDFGHDVDTSLTGKVGSSQTYTPKAFAGYSTDTTPVTVSFAINADGSLTDPIVTITYTRNAQTGSVEFYDDTTQTVLQTDQLNGLTDLPIDFSTVNSDQQTFLQKGYELVSSDVPDEANFDTADSASQDFIVHLKHGLSDPSTPTDTNDPQYQNTHKQFTVKVTGTMPDGTAVTQTNGTQILGYQRTYTTDKVTGDVTYGDWTSDGSTFSDVTATPVTNYTAKAENGKSSVSADDVASQLASFGAATSTDAGAANFNFAYTQTTFTPTNPGTDAGKNDATALTRNVIETVNYQQADGTNTSISQTVKVYRTAQLGTDGQYTYTAWTTDTNGDATKGDSSVTFAAVSADDITSHAAKGYELDQVTTTANGQTDTANQAVTIDLASADGITTDLNVTRDVKYKVSQEKATLTYTDQTTGQVIDTESQSGDGDTAVSFNIADKIDELTAAGYQVVNDADYTKAQAAQFDLDPDTDQTFNINLTETSTTPTIPKDTTENYYDETHKTLTVTVDGALPDGTDETPTNGSQKVQLERTVSVNNVTKQPTFGTWQEAKGSAFDGPIVAKVVPEYTVNDKNAVTIDDIGLSAFENSADDTDSNYTYSFTYTRTTFTPTNPGTDAGKNDANALQMTVNYGVQYGTDAVSPISSKTFYRTATKQADGSYDYTVWTTNTDGISTSDADQQVAFDPLSDLKTPAGYTSAVTTTVNGTAQAAANDSVTVNPVEPGNTAIEVVRQVTYTPDTNTTATVTYHDDTENKDV
ncbi:mucin-binding protein, partial [Secundilactobacillus folii]